MDCTLTGTTIGDVVIAMAVIKTDTKLDDAVVVASKPNSVASDVVVAHHIFSCMGQQNCKCPDCNCDCDCDCDYDCDD